MIRRIVAIVVGVGALIIAPLVLIKCFIALYSGLYLGDFTYVSELANSMGFVLECFSLNAIAILMLVSCEE